MAYVTTNPPRMMVGGAIGGTPNIWIYSSADAATLVRVLGYFTNAFDLGMRAGDLVFVRVSSTNVWTAHGVITCTAAAQADLSDANSLTIVTDSD